MEPENSSIVFFEIVKGTRTNGQVLFRGYENASFTNEKMQTMKLNITGNVIISREPVTLKLKVVGKGLFFGEACNRVDKKEYNGVEFSFEDPAAFTEPDVQNGKCSIWGPFISIYCRVI